jgi:hypothetical protein
MLFRDIEVVLLSSAATADASFAAAVESVNLDVEGNLPSSINIAGKNSSCPISSYVKSNFHVIDGLRPYTIAWNRCLSRGMQKVSPNGNSSEQSSV